MKNKKLEAFDNFEVEPSKEVWSRIESKLPKAKKRRWFLWFIPAILVLFAGWHFVLKGYISSPDQNDVNIIPKANYEINKQNTRNNIPISSATVDKGNEISSNSNSVQSHKEKSKSATVNNFLASTIGVKNNRRSSEKPVVENSNETFRDENISDEEIAMMKSINVSLEEINSDVDVINRNTKRKTEKLLTRWSIFAGSGFMYSNSHENSNPSSESGNNNVDGIKDLYFEIGIRYDLNHRFRLSSGLSYLKAGQEQNSLTKIYLHGPPGNTNNTYSFTSAVGNLTGSGSEFNLAFYDSPDSTLFVQSNVLSTYQDTVKDKYFSLRQEFNYVQLPLMITYKPIERRFTPYAGIYFSAAYLIKQTVILNDERINFKYENGLSDFLFSAGVNAGVEYRLSRSFGIYVQGFYQQGLNSVITGNKWKPYVTGVGGGISYRMFRTILRN